ncbi:LAMI_0B08218g1_1 [Lachancea mirantina]|uniref:LAMI_0B08218g1_1 n=1 Tax=Lachancea mirantina TaxID=1230905 RepID=A0A1G4IXV3_9SACH|nr:LAMI_0B08218g1_1 [Lachancea mirantina]
MNIADSQEEISADQEYELWKSNVPLMYEFVSETKLLWPSLTIQWLPDGGAEDNKQNMLVGTHTSHEEENYVKIASIDLPSEVLGKSAEIEDHPVQSKIRITKKFPHEEEVTRARYCPQKPEIIATINGQGKVFVYDRSLAKEAGLKLSLSFHQENGYGLDFNPNVTEELLSCSDDSTIAIWDVNQNDASAPVTAIRAHTDIVNDCKWHYFDSNILGSVSEDKALIFHDKRSDLPIFKLLQNEPFNTLAFSKHSNFLFAAAGIDSSVYLYDRRNPEVPLHAMDGHQDAVSSLEFSPHKDGIVCSSGADRRVIFWDIKQIGVEQAPDDAADGAPELLMIHAGHKSGVNEFSFNPNVPWLMASAEENNIVHVWKPCKRLTDPDARPDYDIHSLE